MHGASRLSRTRPPVTSTLCKDQPGPARACAAAATSATPWATKQRSVHDSSVLWNRGQGGRLLC